MIAAIVLAILLVLSFTADIFNNVVTGSAGTRIRIPLEEKIIGHSDPMADDYKISRDKIAVIEISGIIFSGSADGSGRSMVEVIREQLKRAAKDDSVKAVILKVNSPGGEVLASDDIYTDILRFRAETGKPVISTMATVAASGGYYVSAPCDWIIANQLTITGSIGVIMSGYNFRGLMDKVGISPLTFKSGKHKDMLSSTRRPEDISDEEKVMVQELITETYTRFTNLVYISRNGTNRVAGARSLEENWTDLVDGRVLSGNQAYASGFVDELGNFETAVKRGLRMAGLEEATLVEYLLPFSFGNLFGFFGKSEETVKIDWGFKYPQLQPGHMYFLMPTAVP